uniref:C-type lectin domain-containing protein n=1 Tax=Anas platyrhynchos TaxID=8839 RepID=A0A8B9T331_ANAPL
GVLLKLSGLGCLVLVVLVVVLSVQVFQKAPTPPNALQNKCEARGRNRTEVCAISSLHTFGVSHGSVSSPGHGGCKLCPPSWQLSGDQCYQVSKSTGNWTEGKKDCESQGSHLAVFRNTTDMHLSEIIRQEELTVWIGLKASNNTWKWVDNSSFDAATFGSLQSVENGCVTFRDKKLEVNGCGSHQNWVCQTEPFHLLSKTAGDRELCSACPEKPILQDSCC